MGYVRTAGLSTAARRRRRRTALVLAALVLLLVLVFGYAAAYYQGWLPEEASTETDQATSTATAAPTLQPADLRVNVYNAGGPPGVAGRIAEELESLGFDVEDVENDPERERVENAIDIRHGPEGLEAAQLLQQEVFRYAELVPDERESPEVDVVLGDAYEELEPEDLRVNVYNASGAAGVARRTAEELESLGFGIEAVDNDPEQETVENAVDIRHGPEGLAQARLLQEEVFPDAELVPDERESQEVDVVLGDAFEQFPAEDGDSSERTGGGSEDGDSSERTGGGSGDGGDDGGDDDEGGG